ncbi:MAG TPA: hypothetical protein VM307_09080 [Egibacteraceae bacterium]|nr:hypothetical protein [Egibacteraceae bacterium]
MRDELTSTVRAQAAAAPVWQDAELHLLEIELRERLAAVGVVPDGNVAIALMATATLLGEHAPEWGGDSRCTLGEVALLGLRLLED